MKTPLLALMLTGTGLLTALRADPSLTIYNQNFGVVRDTVTLDLKAGANDIKYSETTAHLEPDSVILRDPTGKVKLQVLEQNYRNDPVSQELLLSLFEGKTIEFYAPQQNKPDRIIQGKIIRSGYAGNSQQAMQRYGQSGYFNGGIAQGQPIIEVDGKVQFGLPGQPIFPSLGDDTILKPMISWKINADANAKVDAELAYVTGGMSWEADYNVVAPENSDIVDVIGWVTMDNQTGKSFEHAKIKLMAGDVNKIQNQNAAPMAQLAMKAARDEVASAVTEKALDEYHLYSLPRPTTLHDGETKQVEFIHATGVKAPKVYVYDGAEIDWNQMRYNLAGIRRSQEFGAQCNTKVAVLREFKNSEENHLGMPLPKGRVRLYQADGQQLEFTGENVIDHTPKDELLKIYTGNAFDLVGERRQTMFKVSNANDWADEAFEIKLRNHKKEPVEIRVVEHLFRGTNWEITQKSADFKQVNAQEIEFTVALKPDEEKVLTYQVHYTW
jgi:hypothetical protein